MTTDTILDGQRTVTIQGRAYSIRELPWRKLFAFVGQLADHVTLFFEERAGQRVFVFSPERLKQVLLRTDTLAAWLLQECVEPPGPDGPGTNAAAATWIENLSAGAFLALLDEILALNLNEDVVRRGKSIASRLGLAKPSTP